MPTSFHFLRPEWLFALLPAVLLAALAFRALGAGDRAWGKIVDAHLLRHLAQREGRRARWWPVTALLLGWALAALAMAGPTWHRLPSPTLDRRDPTVVVLSLAQSMNATDQSPSRLGAARHKVEDILRRMRGGQVGLVIFSDRPFVAAPLTEDGRVVGQMLPELATDLMPVLNNRPDLAIAKAVELMKGAGAPSGRIVLLTDGPGDAPELADAAAAAAARAGFEVSVIGLGSSAGSPLLAFDGQPLRMTDGTIINTRLDAEGLARLAQAGGGTYTPVTADSADLDRIYAATLLGTDGVLEKSGLAADQWSDVGPWLLLAVLLLAPLAFRRGWIAVLLLTALPALSPFGREAAAADLSSAQSWQDLWQTPDQQGAAAFANDDFSAARQHFQDPAWQASALYKAGDYEAAAEAFGKLEGGAYNRGNALAHAGRLEDAIKAYDDALVADPKNADAAYNRNLVQKLLDEKNKKDEEEKKKQDKKDQQKSPQGSGQNQPQDGGQGQNNPDKKDQGQNDKDKKNQGNKDQGDKDKKPGDQEQGKGQDGKDQDGQGKDGQGQDGKDQDGKGQDSKDQDGKDQDGKGKDGKPDEKQPDKPAGPGKAPQGASPPAAPSPAPKPPAAQAPGQAPGQPAPTPEPKPASPSDPKPGSKPDQQPGPEPQPTPAPTPAPQQGAKPQAAQPRPAAAPAAPPAGPQNPQAGPEGTNTPAAMTAQRAKAEEDQTKEQMLRMVPDDPAGLLRARIRSHYFRDVPPGFEEQ